MTERQPLLWQGYYEVSNNGSVRSIPRTLIRRKDVRPGSDIVGHRLRGRGPGVGR